jgi:DNA-binding transcriptional LysR family regulator
MEVAMQLSDRIGRRMKLHDLHVLMTVVQAGSMSRAARLLNTTQPAVSRSVADLEHTIGARLLDRSRQGVEPTAYGRALLDGGVAVFDDLRQAVKNIEFLADPTVGEVRVGTHDPMIVGLLPAVIDRLRRTHPGISVHVVLATTNAEQYRGLRERSIDLLLGRMTPPSEDDFQSEVLFRDRAAVVAGPQSRWVRRRKVRLAELSTEPWCLPAPDTTIGALVADAFRADGAAFPPRSVVWCAASFMCAMLPRGPYLGILPSSLLRFGANLPRLKVLPVDLAIPSWQVGIMTLKNRTLTPVAQLFIACAREVVKPLASGR